MLLIDRGRPLAGLCYVENLVDAALLALHHEAAPGQVFNVSDGLNVSWRQFTNDLADGLGAPPVRWSLPYRLANGIGFLAENRAETILQVRTVRENLALGALQMWSRMGFVDTGRETREANRLITALSVRCRSPTALAESLSGGNQQKLALGRWLAAERRLLILLDPTAGIDVGARVDIYKHLRNFADSGRGMLIATSDLAEALGLADTIVAFYRGRQVATFTRESRSEEEVVAAITGQRIERGAA